MDRPDDRDHDTARSLWESTIPGARAREVETCEVRWVLPGPLEPDVVAWFARFPSIGEVRDDAYLVIPHLPGLSVKIRGRERLDVKQHRGRAGELAVGGAASGPIDAWLKLSFALEVPPGWPTGETAASWRRVAKRRRISVFPAGNGDAAAAGHEDRSSCSVELTEIRTVGETWWTLGFEAIGSDPVTAIQEAAAIVFGDPLPGNRTLLADEATPYARWIQQR